jgi:hypothetical protein
MTLSDEQYMGGVSGSGYVSGCGYARQSSFENGDYQSLFESGLEL